MLGSVIHYDETSPHMTVYVVPMVGGKLRASHFFDGREKLRTLQTDFAEQVGKPFGLERGIEGSGAKHQTVKQYYANLKAEGTNDPEVAKDKAKQFDFERKNAERRERAVQELRDHSLRLRQIPLTEVLLGLECIPDPKDPDYNWKTPKGRISIDRVDRTKFYNHTEEKGGGGAIDLVCHLLGCQPKESIAWLAKFIGERNVAEELAVQAKLEVAAAKAMPVPTGINEHREDPSTWDRVKAYLTNKRKLGTKLLETLKARGLLWSDRYGNAVFPLSSNGKDQDGVYLRGTSGKPFHGVRGKKGLYVVQGDPSEVGVVESPIDALSFRKLGFSGTVVASCGTPRAGLGAMLKKVARRIVVAFDNDPAGDQMAESLLTQIPDATRVKPEGKDWNEDLIKRSDDSDDPGDPGDLT